MTVRFRICSIATTLICSCFVIACAENENPTHVTTASGKSIPFHEVSRYVRTAAEASSKLYEVSKENVLVGRHMHLNLHQVTELINIPKSTMSLTKNGLPYTAPVHGVSLRIGHNITVAYNSIGDVLAVWGGRHTLIAIRSGTPTVLIDVESGESGPTGELGNDHPTPSSHNMPIILGAMANAVKFKTSSKQTRKRKKFQLAVAFDNEFCAIYKNSYETAVAVVQAVFAAANAPFANQTNVDLSVVHIEGHCEDENDPYASLTQFTATRQTRIVAEIESFWKLRRRHVQRDAMMLLAGFEHKFYRGEAYFASTCNGSGYSWASRVRIRTVAHELAHLLGCRHTESGIMESGSNISIPPDAFTNSSLTEMDDYLTNNPRSWCVT